MATPNITIRNRTRIVRDLASVAVQACQKGGRAIWTEACLMWRARTTVAEQRHAPRAITGPWKS
jgi:hypothetical protein